MPMPNFHSCRVMPPSAFKEGSLRTYQTKQDGLTLIAGKLKSTGKSATQTFRYDKTKWTASRARNHCQTHNGSFEPAVSKKSFDDIKTLTKSAVDFDIRKSKDRELFADHYYLHEVWKEIVKGKKKKHGCWTKKDILDYHSKITDTLRKKEYQMIPKTDLDKESLKIEKTLVSSDIPELMKPGANTAFMDEKTTFAFDICIREQKSRGLSQSEAKKVCNFLKK